MELIFQDKKQTFNETNVESLIKIINDWLGEEFYFSHIIVNGKIVYEEIESYLNSELGNIDVIEIVGRTPEELKNDLLLSAEQYIKRSVEELTLLSDQFYNIPNFDTWHEFGNMLEGMQWLNQLVTSIDTLKVLPENWNEYLIIAASLESELKNLEEAMQNEDYVLIGDIIQYEIKSIYQSLKSEIEQSIDNEGIRNDVN